MEDGIEVLKTALETEKQTNLYLRLHQEELKTVMNRLNALVIANRYSIGAVHTNIFSTSGPC